MSSAQFVVRIAELDKQLSIVLTQRYLARFRDYARIEDVRRHVNTHYRAR
jgi:hypothetical protein